METFRLLHLPLVALQHVVIQMDFIRFATVSRRCQSMVKILLLLKIRNVTIIHTSYEHTVLIEFKPYMEYHRHFKTPEDHYEVIPDKYGFFPGDVPYMHTFNYENESDPNIDVVADMDNFVTFLRGIFPIESTEFYVNSDGFPNFRDFFMNRIVKRKSVCTLFRYGGRNRTYPLQILDEDVHFVLDNLPSDIGICIRDGLSQHFKYDKNLNFKRIDLNYPRWITRDHLLQSKFQQLMLRSTSKLVLSDINLFVKKWGNHEINDEFEYIWIAHPGGYEVNWTENETKMRELLDGIETKPFDKSRNLKEYPRAPFVFDHCCIRLDVDRGDKIASFSIEDSLLVFRVWNKGVHY